MAYFYDRASALRPQSLNMDTTGVQWPAGFKL
jgi:hypothetical protein